VAQVKIPRTVTAMLREIARLMRDPVLAVWSLFVLLIPFYVVASGLPQPGDLLIVPLVPLALRAWNGRLDRSTRRPLMALLAFTAWVIIVDWGWALYLGNFGLFGKETFLLFPVYYVYNTLVFLIVCVLYRRYGVRFLWLTLHIVLASVLMQTAASVVGARGGALRGIGFFNNPNQLGFFALVCASIMALGKRGLGFGSLKAGLAITTCLYLALVSASRAAVIGSAILFVLTVMSNPRRIIAVGLVILGILAIGGPIANAIDNTQQRFTTERYADLTFFEERGYDRILNNKEYWLLGAGEGGTYRFAETTKIGTTEVHSSAGTVFFCYGIIGVVLFLVFLRRLAEGAGLRSTVLLLPALLYTVAHQGLRSTSLWILFGMFVCVVHAQRRKPPAGAAAIPPRTLESPT
jgi:hypothetical protein